MKIAMIISNPFPPKEGIGYYAYNLSKKLIERGHDLSVITRGNIGKAEKLKFEGINVYYVRFIPFYPFHVDLHGLFLKKFINTSKVKFDIFHIHSPLSPSYNDELPLVSTIHTSLVEDIKHFQVVNPTTVSIKLTTYISGRRLIQKLIDNSNIVTTVSSAVAEELKSNYETPNPLVMGNGVDIIKFHPTINKTENYVLYVGRLDYRKGILDLIEAFKYIKTDIKLFIVGYGPLYGLIKEEISKNCMNNVFLLGYLDGKELIKIYQNASIFVFPSYYEGLPTSLLEAMSCALPIITTKIPAHKELIKNNYNGLLVEINNPLKIAENIDGLMDDRTVAKELGLNARKTVEENYTWDKIASCYEKIYLKLIK